MYKMTTKNLSRFALCMIVMLTVSGCSTPEEKAQKYYEKGMQLLETEPNKAKLEFQNALQIKKNMVESVYGLALIAEKQADWKAAFGLLNQVVDLKPDHLEALVKIGQMFLAANNISQADIYLEKVQAIAVNDSKVMLLDAAIDLKKQNFSSAADKAKAILEKDPGDKTAYMLLATERYQLKDTEQALTYINKAIEIDENNLPFKMFKLQLVKSLGNYDEIVGLYKALAKQYPDKPFIEKGLAQYYYENKQFELAENQLKLLVDQQPNEIEPKLDLVRFIGAVRGGEAGRVALEKMVAENPKNYELSFRLVELYNIEKNEKSGDALLQKIITQAGDSKEALEAKMKVAYRLLKKNKKAQAENLTDEVLEKDAGNEKALLLKASFQSDEGDFDAATVTLRKLLRDQPESVEGLFLMAKIQEYMGSTALADESYVNALAASKDSPKVGIPFAKSLVERKQNKRAQKILQDVLKQNPRHIETNKYLAQLRILDGDLDGAKEIAKNINGFSNHNLSNLINGAVLLRQNDVNASLKEFKKAHEAAPKDMQAILAVVNTYISQKNIAAAKAFLNEVLVKDAENYDVQLLLAQLNAKSGNSKESIAVYETAIKQQPNNIKAYRDLASIYVKRNQMGEAKSTLQSGLNVLPNSFDLKMLMAEIHMLENAYEDAIDVYRNLYKDNPNSMVALNNYISVVADYEKKQSEVEEAYKLSKKLSKTNSAQFLDTLGWISYRLGKHDEAIKNIKLAAEKAPNYAVFQYHLGKAYLANGDKENAKTHLEKALSLSKNTKLKQAAEIKELLKNV